MVQRNAIKKHILKFLWVYFCLAGPSLLAQVRIEVEILSPVLDANKPLFIALDYNNWNPGDPAYVLTKVKDNNYYIVLDDAPPSFEYKFTQGSWILVEGTPSGEGLPNRSFDINSAKTKLVQAKILG
jgi:hypothetical protein